LRGVRGEKEGWGERNDPNIVCTYEQKKKNKQKKIEEEEKKKKKVGYTYKGIICTLRMNVPCNHMNRSIIQSKLSKKWKGLNGPK
jgi:hypothetical protein